MFGYHVPAPNEALLISGRKQRGEDATAVQDRHRARRVRDADRSRASRLSLAMQEAEVVEDCFTQQGLTLAVEAVIAFKVGDDHESIAAAARRFQGDQIQMPVLVGRIFSGHLRSIIGSMTVEAIIREQQTLADAIVDASKHGDGPDRTRRRLAADQQHRRQGRRATSPPSPRPHQAAVNQAAKIAQAEADQASRAGRSRRAPATRPSTPGRRPSPAPSTRPRSTRPSSARPRPARWPRPRPSRRCWSSRPWSPSATRICGRPS